MGNARVALAAVLVFQLAVPSLALADPPATPAPLTPVPPGPDVIDIVKAGQVAPHEGQLFDQATALRWANYLQQCQSRLRLDPLYQYKLDQADLTASQKREALQQAEYTRVTTDLQNKLTAAEVAVASPPFYRTMGFGVVLGVLGTLAVGAVVAYAVHK
jgi:hypothetical protein